MLAAAAGCARASTQRVRAGSSSDARGARAPAPAFESCDGDSVMVRWGVASYYSAKRDAEFRVCAAEVSRRAAARTAEAAPLEGGE